MNNRGVVHTIALAILLIVPSGSSAQNPLGRWAIGVRGGVTQWFADLEDTKPGVGGELSVRYSINKFFSLGLLAGYEDLKADQKFAIIEQGIPQDYITAKGFPVSLGGYFHLNPGKRISPYLHIGVGAMMYKREDSKGTAIPPDKDKMLNSIVVPAGVGADIMINRKLAFTIDATYRVFDDYTDFLKGQRSPDGALSGKAGITFFMGSSDADDADGDRLTNGEERRYGTNPEVADSDGDGLRDGEEVKRFRTNPLKTDSDGDNLADGDEVFRHKTDPAKSDTDGDGLPDGVEIATFKTDPVRIDSDGDGLPDGDEANTIKSDPMKVDTDGDGLTDWDEARLYKTDPTRPDTDGDGLTDGEEIKRTRTTPTKADTDGGGVNDGAEVQRKSNPLDPKDDDAQAPIVLEKGKTVVLEGVNFVSGSATLTRESEKILERALAAMSANPQVTVEIAGYTDNVGNPRANDQLSLRRAQSVKTWLVKKGIPANRMTTVGKGMRDPIAPNTTPEGRAKNRRIEFHVLQ